MPRLLAVSPHFPPVNAPDHQRLRMSLPHFVAAGWEVTVLTVQDDAPLAPLEPGLLDTVPGAVRVVRAPVWSRRWTRYFGLGNLGWRAWRGIYAAGCQLLRQNSFDAVYFSTTQFAVLPLGRCWWNKFGVPYVIDLQDPWVGDYYDRRGVRPPGGWKYRIAQLLASALEGWTLRKCAHVISVSPAYLEALARRHAWFRRELATVLTFGAPDEDFAVVRRRAAGTRSGLLPDTPALKIIYVGRLGEDMRPALRVLFRALRRLPAHLKRPVEAHFFGTSYAAAGQGTSSTAGPANEEDVPDRVFERTDRVGYLDALHLMIVADIVLVLGSDDAAYSPSKLFPALMSGRPVLAVTPRGGVLDSLVTELGGVHALRFSGNAQEDEPAVTLLAEKLQHMAEDGGWHPERPADRVRLESRHSARAVALRQLEILSSVSNRPATP